MIDKTNDMIDKTNLSIFIDTNIEKKKKSSKIKDIYIPHTMDYNIFKSNNYTVISLRSFCKNFKLKISGTKLELQKRIYEYLLNSHVANIIQKYFRKYLYKKYNKLLGPGFKNKNKCKNTTDFFTLELLTDINDDQFFSFEENDNIWGFNIISIYNLFVKNKNKDVLNPYTREEINNNVFNSIKQFIKISKILNKNINITLNNEDVSLSCKKRNEIKCLEIFQTINELGNYANHYWFLNLSRIKIIKFIRELRDIWEYRAELSTDKKCKICYPNGNPFRHCDILRINNLNYVQLQKNALRIIHQFITTGISPEYSNLGAYYVLAALTLVSEPAAESLPWLFQSVS